MRVHGVVLGVLACLLLLGSADMAGAIEDPAGASGAGFGTWWHTHGKRTVELAGCYVTGLSAASLLVGGVTGVGGFVIATGIVVAAVACLT
jgi:hypothetical protein